MIAMPLVDLLSLSPAQLKALFDQGDLGKYSMGYLEKANLYHDAIWGKVIGMDSNGDLVWLPQDTTGRMPVKEENSQTINTQTLYMQRYLGLDRESALADGTTLLGLVRDGIENDPVVMTADPAGLVTATDLVAAGGASVALDLFFWFQVDTTGAYLMDMAQDPTGTPAATAPDWNTAPPVVSCVAGYPYGPFHVKTLADNIAFGHAGGPNGSWPNNASVFWYGWHRQV